MAVQFLNYGVAVVDLNGRHYVATPSIRRVQQRVARRNARTAYRTVTSQRVIDEVLAEVDKAKVDTLPEILAQVRRHFNDMFRRMSEVGGTWHLYRVPSTNQFQVFHKDAKFDVPLELAVQNVHALTIDQVCARVQQLLKS